MFENYRNRKTATQNGQKPKNRTRIRWENANRKLLLKPQNRTKNRQKPQNRTKNKRNPQNRTKELAKQCYEEQKNDSTGNHWLGKIKQVLDNLGLSYIHKVKPGELKKPSEINRLSCVTRNRENEIFEQNLVLHRDTQMEENQGKLSFLHKLKENFGQEDYLHINNVDYRQKITQLRLSAHKLEIEIGRHKDIDRENRICRYCRKGEVESEEHFLFSCPNYRTEREDFMTQLVLHDEKYKGMANGIPLLHDIFLSKNKQILELLGKFLYKSWGIRNMMGSNLPVG